MIVGLIFLAIAVLHLVWSLTVVYAIFNLLDRSRELDLRVKAIEREFSEATVCE